MSKKIELECCVCKSKFLKRLQHYVFATKAAQTEFYCGPKCVAEGKKKFPDSPCEWCGTLCPHDRKFCNRKCYGNSKLGVPGLERSKESKDKLSLSQRIKSNNLPRLCENCGTLVERPKRKTQRYCSNACAGAVKWRDPEFVKKILASSVGKHPGWQIRSKGKESFAEKFWREHLDGHIDDEYVQEFKIKKKDIGSAENGNYFLDFYFPSLRLDLEIDGRQHEDRKASDEERDRLLTNVGITVIRYRWPLGSDRFVQANKQIDEFIDKLKVYARFV
jgi:very-short-patch-repair endonuclease